MVGGSVKVAATVATVTTPAPAPELIPPGQAKKDDGGKATAKTARTKTGSRY